MTDQSIGTAAPRKARSSAKRKMLTDLDPTVVLSVLTGVVAVCGLLNQVIFYRFFDISYVSYIGTGDFLALVLQTIPFTLLVVLLTLGVAALTVLGAIYSRAGLVTSFWQLLLALARLCSRILALLGSAFSRTVTWLLRRSDERADVWSADRRDRVAAIAEAAQLLSGLCKSYEPACARRSGAYLQRRQEAAKQRREKIAAWLAFANRRYFEMFLAVTLVTLALGFAFSAAAGWRLEMRLQETDEERADWRMADAVFSVFFPGFLPENSVSVASLQAAIDNAVFLGATSQYGFFVRRDDGLSLVLPAHEIELVTLAKALTADDKLRKPAKDGDTLIAEQLEHVAASVADVGNSLERAGQGMVAFGASLLERLVVPARLSADCRDNLIEGVDFRFAYGDADPLALVTLAGPTSAVSAEAYGVPVAQYNAVQRARLVDYVTTTPFGYLPDDHLLVEGHASSEGTFAYNEELAERRAAQVVEYLREAPIWDRVEAFSRPDVIDVASTWPNAEEIRASFRPVGRGEHAWQNDPLDPRNRRVLIYHCRPQPGQPGEQQMASAATG